MADASSTSADSGGTIDQYLEENGSPGKQRTLRQFCRTAKKKISKYVTKMFEFYRSNYI